MYRLIRLHINSFSTALPRNKDIFNVLTLFAHSEKLLLALDGGEYNLFIKLVGKGYPTRASRASSTLYGEGRPERGALRYWGTE